MKIDFKLMRYISYAIALLFSLLVFLAGMEVDHLLISLLVTLTLAVLWNFWVFWSYFEIDTENNLIIYRKPFKKRVVVNFTDDYCMNVYVTTVVKGNTYTKEQITFIADLEVKDKKVISLEKNDLGYSFAKFNEYQFIEFIIDNINANVVGYERRNSYYNPDKK
ncbi:hypothetical protein CI105_02250 [Candidatus Izimaplasma bacterium ZiA1]|uniref:hypothetical protein n=1 Tax=Candidatus Izimoplasma sp. ZiA1 TaxID=2024899 RepID=UPI000BAA82E3|nr:hypothetical protein CI105_02250 [Candidatus Izimaplasma bacterium ZiA1]